MNNGQSLYNETLSQIKTNKQRVKEGKVNAIPFGFPRFDKVFPGLVQGRYYCITAGTGVSRIAHVKFCELLESPEMDNQQPRFVEIHSRFND